MLNFGIFKQTVKEVQTRPNSQLNDSLEEELVRFLKHPDRRFSYDKSLPKTIFLYTEFYKQV